MNQEQKVRNTCDECESEVDVTIAQTIINGSLRWYKSYSCSSCGAAIELDGDGFPPDEFRNVILDREGEWSLLFVDTNPRKAAIVKVLRKTHNLSISQANQMLQQLPHSSIKGTKTEMLWMQGIFDASGIKARVVKK